MMKSILFNTEEVRAILDDRKSVTRRVIKNNPVECTSKVVEGVCKLCDDKGGFYLPNEYIKLRALYQAGDILYVRETWCRFDCSSCEGDGHFNCSKEPDEREGCYMYRASNEIWGDHWHPSIHMPKEAARIFLRVTDVRVERLQDITPAGCVKEGLSNDIINQYETKDFPMIFGKAIWNRSIKSKPLVIYGWYANPWVWVIEFERISKEEAYKRF